MRRNRIREQLTSKIPKKACIFMTETMAPLDFVHRREKAGGHTKGFAMLVGVPKETKGNEYRVGIVPSTVRELTEKGHQVVVEAGAGLPDGNYRPRRSYLMPIASMAAPS